jgi:hypothetical protein
VLRQAHRTLDDVHEAFLREWLRLEEERGRLETWHNSLEDRTRSASSSFALEREKLVEHREALEEDRKSLLERQSKVLQREAAIGARERKAERTEARLKEEEDRLKRLEDTLLAETARLSSERTTLESNRSALAERQSELEETAKKQADVEQNFARKVVDLVDREAAVKTREADQNRREEALLARERWVRKRTDELAAEEERLKASQAALDRQAQEATLKTVEALREEQHTGALRIAAWADEASTALVPLGISPIPVARTPESLSDALPVLDLAAERLRRLDSTFGSLLEAEGRELCRTVAEHVLVCLRSHFPDLSLEPVIVGPVADAEEAARASVQEVVEAVRARFLRIPGGAADPPSTGDPPGSQQ